MATNQTNLGLSSQPQQSSVGLFGSTKPNTSFGGQQNVGFALQGQSSSMSGFGQQPMTQQTQQASSNLNYMNVQQNQNNPPVFSLLPSNYLKYDKVSSLQDDIKKLIGKIELDLKNNEIYQDYAEKMFKSLNENFKIISSEGVKLVKCCKLINSKNSQIKFTLETLKNELNQQTELLKGERKNFNILEQHPSFKISIPNEYFLKLIQEIEEKMSMQIQEISDLEALINLYYRKEYGSFKVNSDIVEEIIKELYNCLIGLVSEAARINDYVNSLKLNYIEVMKFNYGWKESEIENRMRANLSSGEEIENIYYK